MTPMRPIRLPEKRQCCMCGSPMVEVLRKVTDPARQDWQCPRCLHVEHDVYGDDSGDDER
jgi:hypothetical protein